LACTAFYLIGLGLRRIVSDAQTRDAFATRPARARRGPGSVL